MHETLTQIAKIAEIMSEKIHFTDFMKFSFLEAKN